MSNPRDPKLPFNAKYAGTCCICGNRFPIGATIRKWDSNNAHAGCTKGRKAPASTTQLVSVATTTNAPIIRDINGAYPDTIWLKPHIDPHQFDKPSKLTERTNEVKN